MILLRCSGTNGQIALPSEEVEGLPAPARTYDIVDGWLTIDALHDLITAHDAQSICVMPGFRLATLDEQNEYTGKSRKSKTVKEAASAQPVLETGVNGG